MSSNRFNRFSKTNSSSDNAIDSGFERIYSLVNNCSLPKKQKQTFVTERAKSRLIAPSVSVHSNKKNKNKEPQEKLRLSRSEKDERTRINAIKDLLKKDLLNYIHVLAENEKFKKANKNFRKETEDRRTRIEPIISLLNLLLRLYTRLYHSVATIDLQQKLKDKISDLEEGLFFLVQEFYRWIENIKTICRYQPDAHQDSESCAICYKPKVLNYKRSELINKYNFTHHTDIIKKIEEMKYNLKPKPIKEIGRLARSSKI